LDKVVDKGDLFLYVIVKFEEAGCGLDVAEVDAYSGDK
jgi:hypothetical protein